ncbi:MAG: hypothetical protein NXY57DRAFT_1044468, partial [Lentinula lateritia]
MSARAVLLTRAALSTRAALATATALSTMTTTALATLTATTTALSTTTRTTLSMTTRTALSTTTALLTLTATRTALATSIALLSAGGQFHDYLSDVANYFLHKAAEDNSDYPDAVDPGEAEDADEDGEELWIADQVPDFDMSHNSLQDHGTFPKKDMIHSQQNSDLDKLLLSLLDEPAPTQNSFTALPASALTTSSTQHPRSYFATSNSDPGSRKRRHSQANHEEHIPRQRHGAVNAHADPVEPRPDCNRNGGSASRKRLRVDSQANRQDVEEEEEEEAPNGTQYLYEASQTPHPPPKEVTDVALAWML